MEEDSADKSSRPKLIGRKCILCNSYKSLVLSKKYHKFPLNPEMSNKWAEASQKKWVIDASVHSRHVRYRICEDHFLTSHYTTSSKTRLKADAVPFVSQETSVLTSIKSALQQKLQRVVSQDDEAASSSTSSNIEGPPVSPMEASPIPPSSPVCAHQASTPRTPSSTMPRSKVLKQRKLLLTPKTKKIKVLSSKLYYLKRKLIKFGQRTVKLDNVLKTIKSLVKPVIYSFIAGQLKSSRVSKYGRRWSMEDKNLALQLYLASPKAYRVLCSAFNMPSKTTLIKCVSGIKMAPGFSSAILSAMSLVASRLKPHDKLCILSFDEMKLKSGLTYNSPNDVIEGFENYGTFRVPRPKLATHALVFMVRGLCKKWKQVFGYFFSCETTPSLILKHLLNEAISKLRGCGLVPIAVVCDQGASNQQLYKKDLGVSPEKPYFFFQDHKIYCLSDAPHLLKCLRNNFKRYPVMFTHKGTRKIAYWEHIVKLYERDSQNDLRVLPRLTRRHIEVDGLSSMNVRLAAQVLSRSVGAQLCFMTSVGALPSSGSSTAEFCDMCNDMFDSVNSRKISCPNRLLSAVTKSSPHVEEWKRFSGFMKSIVFQTQFVTTRKINFPCEHGWLLTLSSFSQLVPELLTTVPFVLMSRFTQDALENFFSVVRRKGGNNDHPTPYDFSARMRMLMAQHILNTLGNESNCEPDSDTLLVNMQVLKEAQDQQTSFQDGPSTDYWCELDDDLQTSPDIFSRNAASYVAGYVAKIILKRYPCEACKACLVGDKTLSVENLFIYFKEFDSCKEGLCVPTDSWALALCEFGSRFPDLFNEYCCLNNVGQNISNSLLLINHDWLICATHKDDIWENLVKFYVRIMIFYKVKFVSQSFRDSKRPKKKLKKLS